LKANKINKELRESIARGEDRNALFRQLNIANQSVVDAREKFDLSTEGSDINARINEARKKFNSNPTQSRRERLELLKEEKRELEKNIGIGALEDTVNQLRNYILALDFDMSKPAKKVV
jgi:predicted  nucleic acid-binding Zn-ribbon protein